MGSDDSGRIMMRKFVIFVLLIGLFASSVSAAGFDSSNFINVLDYTTFDRDGDNFLNVVAGSNEFIVDLPFKTASRYVDLLLITNASGLEVKVNNNSTSDRALTVEQISTNFFRVYGSIPFRTVDSFTFTFDITSGSWIEVLQFRYSEELTNDWAIDAYCKINAAEYNSTIHYVPTDSINYRSWPGPSSIDDTYYQLYIWVEDWKKYDYIDIQLFLDVASINSISGYMGSDNIDIQYSWVGSESWDSNMYLVTLGIDCSQFLRTVDTFPEIRIIGNTKFELPNSVDFVSCTGTVFRQDPDVLMTFLDSRFAGLINLLGSEFRQVLNSFVRLENLITNNFLQEVELFTGLTDRLVSLENLISSNFTQEYELLKAYHSDVRAAFASVEDTIVNQFLLFRINLDSNFQNVLDQISDFNDSVDSNHSALMTRLTQIKNDIVNAINGDLTPGQHFQEDVEQVDDQLDNMIGIMDSVEKPELNDVQLDVDQLYDPNVLTVSMSGLTSVMTSDIFMPIFLMSFIFATAGFVLYGKR